MKALIFKELKLAMHPICYLFVIAFPFMILIPSYPIGIGFIYVLVCYPILFLGANKGQQSNDLLYTTLLPVRKKDIVMARIITVILIQLTFIIILSALYPIACINNNNIIQSATNPEQYKIPGLGLECFTLLLAIAIVGYAIADLIYFPIYYKKGKSIVMSTLLTILGFVVYICFLTIGLPYLVGEEIFKNLYIGIQLGALAGALLISFGIHFAVYKIASKRLEKVDF